MSRLLRSKRPERWDAWPASGERIAAKQVEEKNWGVSFVDYDLEFFDHGTCRIESAASPCAAKVSPVSPV